MRGGGLHQFGIRMMVRFQNVAADYTMKRTVRMRNRQNSQGGFGDNRGHPLHAAFEKPHGHPRLPRFEFEWPYDQSPVMTMASLPLSLSLFFF